MASMLHRWHSDAHADLGRRRDYLDAEKRRPV